MGISDVDIGVKHSSGRNIQCKCPTAGVGRIRGEVLILSSHFLGGERGEYCC